MDSRLGTWLLLMASCSRPTQMFVELSCWAPIQYSNISIGVGQCKYKSQKHIQQCVYIFICRCFARANICRTSISSLKGNARPGQKSFVLAGPTFMLTHLNFWLTTNAKQRKQKDRAPLFHRPSSNLPYFI